MLYVSVRWSRFVTVIRRRSSGRIGRIVAIVTCGLLRLRGVLGCWGVER